MFSEEKKMRIGKENLDIRKLTFSAACLALALLLPLLTGNIPEIGNMLCPMHFPILLCGFLCGGPWGAAVGLAAPILRSMIFSRPVMYPTALSMMFELAVYGLVAGLLYSRLPKKWTSLYVSLIAAMIGGRIMGGVAQAVLLGFGGKSFGMAAFVTEYFVNAWPGIIVQIVLIPLVISALEKAHLIPKRGQKKA